MTTSKENIEWVAYVIENYRRIKGYSGKEVADIFDKYNLYDFVQQQYDWLHVEGPEANAKVIDEFIKQTQ